MPTQITKNEYNPDWLYDKILEMPEETVLYRIKIGEIDLNKRFVQNNDTLWHILASSDETKHSKLLRLILNTHYSSINLKNLSAINGAQLAPTHLAAIEENLETIRVLMSFGVNPNQPCPSAVHNYATPRDFLKKDNPSLLLEMDEIILQHEEIQALKEKQNQDKKKPSPFVKKQRFYFDFFPQNFANLCLDKLTNKNETKILEPLLKKHQ